MALTCTTTMRLFQHTAARRRLAAIEDYVKSLAHRFNTQPPEGGWRIMFIRINGAFGFNTQPPEGGWSMAIPCLSVR